MAEEFHLVVAIPEQEPVSHALAGDKVTLGRSPDNDIQVLVREISTSHCEFHKTDSGYEVVDNGSTNGTKVEGQSVKNGRLALAGGAVLLLGETVPAYFVAVAEGETVDATAVAREHDSKKEEKEAAGPVVAALTPPGAKKAAPAAPSVPGSPPAPGTPPGSGGPAPVPPAKKAPPLGAKPPSSAPLKPTLVEDEEADQGANTVKLAQAPGPPATKLAPPPMKKAAAPGPPAPQNPGPPSGAPAPKPLSPPSSKKLPALKKVASPPPSKKLPKLNPPGKDDQ